MCVLSSDGFPQKPMSICFPSQFPGPAKPSSPIRVFDAEEESRAGALLLGWGGRWGPRLRHLRRSLFLQARIEIRDGGEEETPRSGLKEEPTLGVTGWACGMRLDHFVSWPVLSLSALPFDRRFRISRLILCSWWYLMNDAPFLEDFLGSFFPFLIPSCNFVSWRFLVSYL